MNITKEALLERGFIADHPNVLLKMGDEIIGVRVLFNESHELLRVKVSEFFDPGMPYDICALNCRTLEQLDSLINMFLG